MVETCGTCDYRLWSEEHSVDVIRATLYFDDEEYSDTYTEHVICCPGCGVSLVEGAIRPEGVGTRSG